MIVANPGDKPNETVGRGTGEVEWILGGVDSVAGESSVAAQSVVGRRPRLGVNAQTDGRPVDDDAARLSTIDVQTYAHICTSRSNRPS